MKTFLKSAFNATVLVISVAQGSSNSIAGDNDALVKEFRAAVSRCLALPQAQQTDCSTKLLKDIQTAAEEMKSGLESSGKVSDSSSAAKREYKAVNPTDVRATPEKWLGRDIEFRNVRVYWVEDSDVRFITNENLTLFASDVKGPPEGVKFLRQNCETQQEMSQPKCRVNIRFRYKKHGEDKPNGFSTRVILISDDAEISRPAKR